MQATEGTEGRAKDAAVPALPARRTACVRGLGRRICAVGHLLPEYVRCALPPAGAVQRARCGASALRGGARAQARGAAAVYRAHHSAGGEPTVLRVLTCWLLLAAAGIAGFVNEGHPWHGRAGWPEGAAGYMRLNLSVHRSSNVGSSLTPHRRLCRRHLCLLLRRAGSRCCGWASGHWSRCSDGSRTTATSHGTRCLPSKRRSQRQAAWRRGGSALRVPRSLRRTWRALHGGATLEAPRGERQLAMVWQLVRCTQGQLLAQDSGCKLDVALARPRPCIRAAYGPACCHCAG